MAVTLNSEAPRMATDPLARPYAVLWIDEAASTGQLSEAVGALSLVVPRVFIASAGNGRAPELVRENCAEWLELPGEGRSTVAHVLAEAFAVHREHPWLLVDASFASLDESNLDFLLLRRDAGKAATAYARESEPRLGLADYRLAIFEPASLAAAKRSIEEGLAFEACMDALPLNLIPIPNPAAMG